MFNAFRALFQTFVVFFGAIEKFAKAADHLGGWAEEAAGAVADQARIERQARMNAALKDLKVSEKALQTVK